MAVRVETETEALGLTGWKRLAKAARLAQVGRSTLDEAAARDELPYIWLDDERFFKVEDVLTWAEQRRQRA
jgi:hypothetical protein